MYTPIVGSLGYVLSPDRLSVLLVHRISKKNDDHLGKYNGLGGKMERGEDVVSCMKRELYEEAGIEAEKVTLRGTINWTNFGKKGEDWLGCIFLIESFSGTPFAESPEGPLYWIPIADLDKYPMWPGDRLFLPLVFDSDPRPFHGYMPYKNGAPTLWSFTR